MLGMRFSNDDRSGGVIDSPMSGVLGEPDIVLNVVGCAEAGVAIFLFQY